MNRPMSQALLRGPGALPGRHGVPAQRAEPRGQRQLGAAAATARSAAEGLDLRRRGVAELFRQGPWRHLVFVVLGVLIVFF